MNAYKKKTYAIKSVIGFALALALAFCLYAYNSCEQSYDSFTSDARVNFPTWHMVFSFNSKLKFYMLINS